jgi:beta-lactamase regulating signal transducer with metallopeptidase domain
LGKSAAPRFRYALSLLVLVRLLLPLAPASPFSIENLLPRKTPAAIVANAPFRVESVQVPARIGVVAAPSLPQTTDHAASLSWPDMFCLIWLFGFLVLTGLAVWRYLKWRHWINTGNNITEPRLLALIESCRLEMGVGQPVKAVAVPQAKAPAVFGIRHACLLWPRDVLSRLDESELRLVVLHEMAHVRRKDSRLNALMMAIQYAHWFNPLVWIAFHRTRADAELICDEMVMRLSKPKDRNGYGQLLLKLLAEFPGTQFIPNAAGVVGSKQEIRRRIIMIKNHGQSRMAGCALAIMITALLAFVTFTRAQSSSPSISAADQATDVWFVMNRNNLLKVPPGLVIFRPTHFYDNIYKNIISAPYAHNGHEVRWVMGRDLPLRVAIAVAYKLTM